jgi:hypothetical protein
MSRSLEVPDFHGLLTSNAHESNKVAHWKAQTFMGFPHRTRMSPTKSLIGRPRLSWVSHMDAHESNKVAHLEGPDFSPATKTLNNRGFSPGGKAAQL